MKMRVVYKHGWKPGDEEVDRDYWRIDPLGNLVLERKDDGMVVLVRLIRGGEWVLLSAVEECCKR